jgi:hypothetical protein
MGNHRIWGTPNVTSVCIYWSSVSYSVTHELRVLVVQEPRGLWNTGRAVELRQHRESCRATEAPEKL